MSAFRRCRGTNVCECLSQLHGAHVVLFSGLGLDENESIRGAEIQNVGLAPVLSVTPDRQPERLFSLAPTGPSFELDEESTRAIALAAAERVIGHKVRTIAADVVDRDQWTVSGIYNPHRPLFQ